MNTTQEQMTVALAEAMGWKRVRLPGLMPHWEHNNRTISGKWNPFTSHDDCQVVIDWCRQHPEIWKFILLMVVNDVESLLTMTPAEKLNACYRACVAAGLITEPESEE